MADYPELIYWLTLINESDLKLNLVKPIIQQWCFAERRSLAELFDMSPLEWSARFGLPDKEAERAARARNKLPQAAAAVVQWQAQRIEPLIRTDPRYPQRLVNTLAPAKQPLVLWARGNLGWLNEPAIAVLGGQTPDDPTQKLIGELMRVLAAEGIGLVSGYGRGLDRATFEVMLATPNGHAITVLPMGLNAFAKTTTKLDAAAAAGQVVLVSPFAPQTAFQEKLAEARNLLIDHLALALLILHTDDESLARGSDALDRDLPIFVGMTDTTGNRTLIDQGALLFTDPGEVVEAVQQAVIDAALLEAPDNFSGPVSAALSLGSTPTTSPVSQDDDFDLHLADYEPIDGDEALDILSISGNVPEILRRRLQKS
jgi:predicted Rossmann fold nucleotide-binding protein DprA/Smf involved in DNA uptake